MAEWNVQLGIRKTSVTIGIEVRHKARRRGLLRPRQRRNHALVRSLPHKARIGVDYRWTLREKQSNI